jgi:hypothetical protein
VSDPLISFDQFGEMLAGASARTAKRRATEAGLSTYHVGGRTLILRSDAEAYIESCRVDHTAQVDTLKSIVQRAVQRARERRVS